MKPGLCVAETPVCTMKGKPSPACGPAALGQGAGTAATAPGSGGAALPELHWDPLLVLVPISTCVLALEGVHLESLIRN